MLRAPPEESSGPSCALWRSSGDCFWQLQGRLSLHLCSAAVPGLARFPRAVSSSVEPRLTLNRTDRTVSPGACRAGTGTLLHSHHPAPVPARRRLWPRVPERLQGPGAAPSPHSGSAHPRPRGRPSRRSSRPTRRGRGVAERSSPGVGAGAAAAAPPAPAAGRHERGRRVGAGRSLASAPPFGPRLCAVMKMKVLLCPAALLFIVAAFSLEPCRCAKVLIMPTIVFDSHLRVFMRVAEALTERGHDPVLLLHEGRDVETHLPAFRVQRYWGIFSTQNADAWVQEKIKRVFQGKMTSLEMFSFLEKYLENCDLVLGNSTLLQKLQREHFDLLLVDPNEMCGFILAHILGVKYAVISTGFWFPAEIGATSPIAYVPEFNSLMTDRMSFFGRTWNLLVYVITRVATKLVILPKFERLMEKHGVEPKISMLDLVHGSSLFFLCNDVVLDFPRPTLPHVIFTGGILAEPAKPLPVGLRLWVEAADAGVVVVSFGIGIRALPSNLVEKMSGAFARLPQRVVWRYFGQKPRNLGENTLMMDWLPQNDLLGHPNVKAFVSHCGMNGIFEAIYHGVPVVGFPFYGDQFDIMTRVQAKGMGILLDWNSVTEEELYQAVVMVITDPSYKKAAKLISALHLDTPMHALNRTVYWLEYILRHNGAPYLRPAVYDLSLYEYFCLDILALLLLCLASMAFVLYKSVVWCRRKAASPVYQNGNCMNGHFTEQKKLQ